MKYYLLDTNSVIMLLNNTNAALTKRLRQHKPTQIYLPSIVIHELFYGAFKSQRTESNVSLVDSLQLRVLEFNKEDARQASEVRATLTLKGKPIGPYDVLIAGQAKARNMTLITHNTQEFSRVEGLMIEDWQKT